MLAYETPSLTLENLRSVLVGYERGDDILYLYINESQPAVTEPLDGGWYLRIVGDEVAGLEIFGLQAICLADPFYARLFAPAMAEIEAFTGKSFASDDIQATATVEGLPRTAQILIFLMGQAITRYETIRQAEYEAAARERFATSP